MRGPSIAVRALLAAFLLYPAAAGAADVKVMISGGFSAAYETLVPQF